MEHDLMRWNNMKKTVRDNIQTAYSLHDMNVIAFEVSGNDVTMRTQSGVVKTTPPYKQVDGFVEFHDLDWNFSFVYLMGGYGNVGKFTGEKLYLRDFIERFPSFGFEVIDEVFGYNQTKLWGFLSANREVYDCVIELYHLGDMVYVAEE